MKKLFPLIALSILFLVPISAQSVFADVEADVLQLLDDNSEGGTVGVYLKEVNGAVIADFNESFVFEPASTIKVTHHLKAMLEVQTDQNFDLTTSVNYFQDSEDDNGAIIDDPNTSGDERASGCPVDTGASSDTLENGLTAMMVPSDNRWTQAFRVLLGEGNINAMMQNLGMSDSLIQHRIGCAADANVNHNMLTLVDAGKLYEAVANGFLNPNVREDFYEIMLQDTSRFEIIIDDEVLGLTLSTAGLEEFKDLRDSALKAGSYKIGDDLYRSVAGWAELPFRNGGCDISPQQYVFGTFIHEASALGPIDDIRTFGVELFRDEIRDALESWADCEVDLAVEKETSDNIVVAGGDPFTYTVTVDNNGPNDATNVVVDDELHPLLKIEQTPISCVDNLDNTLTCDLNTILDGGTDSFEIEVSVPADFVYNGGNSVGNVAKVSSDQFDINSSNDEADVFNQVIAEADLEIVLFEVSQTPGEIFLGESFDVTLTKKIINKGPSSPVDVSALGQASGDGVSVDPDQVFPVVNEIKVNDPPVTILEDFTVTCDEPGTHDVVFTNEITPNDATDPDTSDNEAEITIQIDCVIPVEINIHPGSYPNSINLKSKNGVVPLAILTTDQGEYGLPVAVDVTMIDPFSVHFGPENLLFNVEPALGATEFHNRGHAEDSFELDDATKDGDIDMVLHFKVKESGLDAADSEGCVKGIIDIGGMPVTFFGCDYFVSKP